MKGTVGEIHVVAPNWNIIWLTWQLTSSDGCFKTSIHLIIKWNKNPPGYQMEQASPSCSPDYLPGIPPFSILQCWWWCWKWRWNCLRIFVNDEVWFGSDEEWKNEDGLTANFDLTHCLSSLFQTPSLPFLSLSFFLLFFLQDDHPHFHNPHHHYHHWKSCDKMQRNQDCPNFHICVPQYYTSSSYYDKVVISSSYYHHQHFYHQHYQYQCSHLSPSVF